MPMAVLLEDGQAMIMMLLTGLRQLKKAMLRMGDCIIRNMLENAAYAGIS